MSWKQDIITEITELKGVLKTKLNALLTKVESKAVKMTADQPNAKINLLDINSNIISTLDVAFLNNEGTTIFFNTTAEMIELKNDAGDVLSSFPASALMTGVPFGIYLTGSTLALVDSANAVVDSVTLKIANIQGLQAALDAKATPADIKDGQFTVSGTGSLTGSGSMTANQSGNTTAQLDLTQAEKDKINHGETAYGYTLQDIALNGNSTTEPVEVSDSVIINKSILSQNTTDPGILVETNIAPTTGGFTRFFQASFEVFSKEDYESINKITIGGNNYNSTIRDYSACATSDIFGTPKVFFNSNSKLCFWFDLRATNTFSTGSLRFIVKDISYPFVKGVKVNNLTIAAMPASGVTALTNITPKVQATESWVTAQLNALPSGYTDEEAQDAVGTILSANFTYDDNTPSIDLSSAVITNINNGATAYGWGNHASAGYLKTETDTLQSVTDRGASTTKVITVKALKVTDTPLLNGATNDKVLTTDASGNLKLVDGAESYVTIPDWSGDLLAGLNF